MGEGAELTYVADFDWRNCCLDDNGPVICELVTDLLNWVDTKMKEYQNKIYVQINRSYIFTEKQWKYDNKNRNKIVKNVLLS